MQCGGAQCVSHERGVGEHTCSQAADTGPQVGLHHPSTVAILLLTVHNNAHDFLCENKHVLCAGGLGARSACLTHNHIMICWAKWAFSRLSDTQSYVKY